MAAQVSGSENAFVTADFCARPPRQNAVHLRKSLLCECVTASSRRVGSVVGCCEEPPPMSIIYIRTGNSAIFHPAGSRVPCLPQVEEKRRSISLPERVGASGLKLLRYDTSKHQFTDADRGLGALWRQQTAQTPPARADTLGSC